MHVEVDRFFLIPNWYSSTDCWSNDDRARKVFRSRQNISSDDACRSQAFSTFAAL